MSRIAVIHKEKCNPMATNYLCIRVCPVNRAGKECIIKGPDGKPVINEELCIGCGICQNRCANDAISIINLPEALKESPIHRFGDNGFALYSLPMPIFGKVVGIIGRNGIGKSTAIKVLAGVLKPNLSQAEKEAGPEELIEFFKGTEMQTFFEKLKKGEIKVSYKPQHVDLIAKTQKGKVGDLLKKVDERSKLAEIARLLGIAHILDHEISDVSGGELQRIAIAATVLRDANLYIFDEPTSYLDIKQRLIVSRFIRELADEKTAVLVIEHDLVALDYMTDLMHIMYGKEDAYGIVSQPRSSKAGINVYLEGFMKEENVRFRDHQIKFEIRPPSVEAQINLLVRWPQISKKLGSFSLLAEEGDIYKHEIVGVLGENGIGKTSFVKILAGVIEPDGPKPDKSITVSYKPQYLDTTSDELVANVLSDALEKFENEIIRPLNIKPLLTKQLNQLSGGEAQRVAIARAMSQKCQLVLLDEPSAYLDVEQRLIVSKIIRAVAEQRGMSVIVVDHDLVFLDYLSQRLLVFEGEPAVSGKATGPHEMEVGMNTLLAEVGITLRREEHSGRPRINKEGSQKDKEQKSKGRFYYS